MTWKKAFDIEYKSYKNLTEYLSLRYTERLKQFHHGTLGAKERLKTKLFWGSIIYIVFILVSFNFASKREFIGIIIISVVFFVMCMLMYSYSKKYFKEEEEKGLQRLIKDEFFCPHCHKIVLTEQIHDINCPVCESDNTFFEILNECNRCKTPLMYFQCPLCYTSIDFKNETYSYEKIKADVYGQK